MARALHKIIPYINPHLIFGRVTRINICQPLAPSDTAASSSEVPCSCITGINSRATNGRVTNRVAMIIPGTEKMILIPCSTIQGPNTPRGLKRRINTRPAITGDTAKGSSIRDKRTCFPLKRNFVTSHAATIPNIVFNGTTITATRSVSLIADSASLSVIAARYTSTPCSNALIKIAISGTNNNKDKYTTAIDIRTILIHLDSFEPFRFCTVFGLMGLDNDGSIQFHLLFLELMFTAPHLNDIHDY